MDICYRHMSKNPSETRLGLLRNFCHPFSVSTAYFQDVLRIIDIARVECPLQFLQVSGRLI